MHNQNNNCVFCKIIAGEIPSKKIYEDEDILIFYDINPVAPVHVLAIPKIHIESLNSINIDNIEYIPKIFEKIPEIAKNLGIFEDGYRVITNIGENGQQSVGHLHFHIIGGRKLKWEF
ncbi:MAG: histidine triad nucleotide-binding protein [Oscillospiraceae bacterium]|nr:histidine triad nucleotide-binding protein [Oscillospiraceae bacterium]